MRTAAINQALSHSISLDRLDKYLAASGGDIDAALALYERNMRLSEAFYSPLQCMEICFRNRLHIQLEAAYGSNWPTNGLAPLQADAIKSIQDIVTGFKGGSPSVGAIIAELHFGFWVGLIGPRYDNSLWRKCLHKAFRVGGGKRRNLVHSRFNALRRFRNRIAHHEPIFDRELLDIHSQIIEAIGWMCADTSAWAAHHSRVFEVVAAP